MQTNVTLARLIPNVDERDIGQAFDKQEKLLAVEMSRCQIKNANEMCELLNCNQCRYYYSDIVSAFSPNV